MTAPRHATIDRATKETQVRLRLALDGEGRGQISTGLPFYDHMLDQLVGHGLIDLELEAKGDLEVDAHHTVEDVALCLGQAFDEALGDRAGLRRFGSARVPLDEALAEVTLDFGGRPYCVFDGGPIDARRGERVGTFPAELVRHFFQSFSSRARCAVHVRVLYGDDLHHCIEAAFKAFARACREATEADPRRQGVASTKGTLSA